MSKTAIEQADFGQTIRCVLPIAAGETIFPLPGRVVPAADRYTVQIDATSHLDPDGHDWRLTNHSCQPNAVMDVDRRELRALRPIAAGEDISFDYNTTEWSMAAPFACECREPGCLGTVRGFRFLSHAQRNAIAGQLSAFLRGQLMVETLAAD